MVFVQIFILLPILIFQSTNILMVLQSESAKEIHVNPIDYDQFITAYRNISSISLPDLVEILIIFNFCINGKEISTIEALNLNLSEIKEVKESFQKEGLNMVSC